MNTINNINPLPGKYYPLGATFTGEGTNFSLYSGVANKVELCLISPQGDETRILVTETTGSYWHIYIPEIKPGQRYGYRVYGDFNLNKGLRCNPEKFLLDPYAKAFDINGLAESPAHNTSDHMMTSVVTDSQFDWTGDIKIKRPCHEMIIYEAHVKGMTATHPDIPENLRGTYAGLAHDSIINYLKDLGITAIELMPIHQFVHDGWLLDKGLCNYWGYNTIGFFAPHAQYSSTIRPEDIVQEFKNMVRTYHQADIEVILDVVYNHTAEGNEQGPTISFRGIDNPEYYYLTGNNKAGYVDNTTGTGNRLNAQNLAPLQLIMDSLRYWVQEMHIDGFRFDLAPSLAHNKEKEDKFDICSIFFFLIHQDPIISQVKLIAEPWDTAGDHIGQFPEQWSEWNDAYRDAMRVFWRGDPSIGNFATRLAGSADKYAPARRPAHASINFITCHDGFTLADLVSYNEKHNPSLEGGKEGGTDCNRSCNYGVEGPTDNKTILAMRFQQQRNFLATLFLSQGVPMLLHGDELGRTQNGNNNPYYLDSSGTWIDWTLAEQNSDLLTFTQSLIALRKNHPIFHRCTFFPEDPKPGDEEIMWCNPDGRIMNEGDWNNSFSKALMIYLNGETLKEYTAHGERVYDDSFLLLFNAHNGTVNFHLPQTMESPQIWQCIIDTSHPVNGDTSLFSDQDILDRPGRSLAVLIKYQG